MTPPQWHPTKAAMLAACPHAAHPEALLLAQDVSSTGGKQFAAVPSFRQYTQHVPNGYEIINTRETRTYAYFDIESDDVPGEDAQEEFTRFAVVVILRLFGLDKSAIGDTAQIATCHRATRASVHVKVNVECTPETCLEYARGAAAEFPHVDLGVYGNFRCYRRLGCAKAAPSRPPSTSLWRQPSSAG